MPGWLKDSLAGLTWKRYGIFCLVVLAFASTRPAVTQALMNPGERSILAGWAIAFFYGLLNFTPVLLAVVLAENRGPRSGTKRIVVLAAAVTVALVIGALLWTQISLWLGLPGLSWLKSTSGWAVPRRYLGLILSDLIMPITAVTFWYLLRRDLDSARALQREQADREAVERQTAEARLQVMRAQIEPHFLFNTLASIRRLYQTDAAAGRTMIQHLSRYLTASLPILRDTRSTLGRELALTLAYLNVQKIRMGARLEVTVDAPSSLHDLEVPPMMLATLVENAVIHGLGPLTAGGRIVISARMDDDTLVIEVADTGRGLQDTWGVGLGLANIRSRLTSQYGARAELRLVANDPHAGVTATLLIPPPTNDARAVA